MIDWKLLFGRTVVIVADPELALNIGKMPDVATVVFDATLDSIVYDPVLRTDVIGYAPLSNIVPSAIGVLKKTVLNTLGPLFGSTTVTVFEPEEMEKFGTGFVVVCCGVIS